MPFAQGTSALSELVEDVLAQIQGYGAASDQVTTLAGGIGADDLTLTVDDASGISSGTIEVGDELMWVKSYDEPSNTVTLLRRGWRGTTATSHSSGDVVTISPTVGRHAVKRALLNTVNAVWPTVFEPVATELSYDSDIAAAYELPADAEIVLDVSYRDLYDNWQRIRHWELESDVNTTDFSTGVALRLWAPAHLGATVRVLYGRRPQLFTSDTDTLGDVGLSESARELLVLGAVARLLPALDIGRLSVTHAAADELDQPIQLGSAVSLAKAVKQEFQEALLREQAALQRQYPGRVHFTR